MVNRGNIFNQVIDLFSDDYFLKEYPLYIKFEGEIAVDFGGVQRDMLSAFWEEAYIHFFDGSSLLVPTVHPNVDMSLLPKLGLILSPCVWILANQNCLSSSSINFKSTSNFPY